MKVYSGSALVRVKERGAADVVHTGHANGNGAHTLLYDRLPTRAKPRQKAIEDTPPRTPTRSRVWHNGAHQHEALSSMLGNTGP